MNGGEERRRVGGPGVGREERWGRDLGFRERLKFNERERQRKKERERERVNYKENDSQSDREKG